MIIMCLVPQEYKEHRIMDKEKENDTDIIV